MTGGVRLATGEHFHSSDTTRNHFARGPSAPAIRVCHHPLVGGIDGGAQ